MVGHYSKCCIKTGKLKKLPNIQKQHIAGAHEPEDMYYDKDDNVRTCSSQYMLSTQKGKNELIIQFGCGTDLDSMDQKIAMRIDTGGDVNTINRTTFKKLFPNTKLQPSTVILKNFDSSYIQPMGKFKVFLHWKSKRYRVDIEVMDSTTTPNVLSRESTFCMGILKPCFVLKKFTRKEGTPSTTTDTPSTTTDTPSSFITLPYFNRNKYTTLQTDALKKGFGAVILQDNKPRLWTTVIHSNSLGHHSLTT